MFWGIFGTLLAQYANKIVYKQREFSHTTTDMKKRKQSPIHIDFDMLQIIVMFLSEWGNTELIGGMNKLVPVILVARAVCKDWCRAIDYRWLGDLVLSVGGAYEGQGVWGSIAGQWRVENKPYYSRWIDRGPWDASDFANVDDLFMVVVPYTVSVLLRVRADALVMTGEEKKCPIRHCVFNTPLRTMFFYIVSRLAGKSGEGVFLRSMQEFTRVANAELHSLSPHTRNTARVVRTAYYDKMAACVSAHVEDKRALLGDSGLANMGDPLAVQEVLHRHMDEGLDDWRYMWR